MAEVFVRYTNLPATTLNRLSAGALIELIVAAVRAQAPTPWRVGPNSDPDPLRLPLAVIGV
jgi:hypothetical protein